MHGSVPSFDTFYKPLQNCSDWIQGQDWSKETKTSKGNKDFQITGENYSSSFGHGGFWLGYSIKPSNLLHLGIDTKLGWGNITTKSNALAEGEIKDDVFVFSPQVFGEANISYWFKVNAGVGFQKVIGVDNYFESSDFDSPSFSISLLFGWFN